MVWYAYQASEPKLSGYAFSGKDPATALAAARAEIARYANRNNLIPIITIKDSNDSTAK